LGEDRVVLTLQSVFALDGVMVALVENVDDEVPPKAMLPLGDDGLSWSLDVARPDVERHRLRLAASSGGSVYYELARSDSG
jgi:hypothetical protein